MDIDFINKEFYYAESLYQLETKWKFIEGQQLIERIKKNSMYKTNYEVLQKGKYEYLKYYFDVDKYVDIFNEEDCNKLLFIMRDNIYNAFKSYLENIEGISNFEPKIIYATSNDKNYKVKEGKFKDKFKYSFRYYINNIITDDILDIKNFVDCYNSNLPEFKIDDLDHKLYSCNQKIRMVNSSKDENYYKRPLIIDENLFKVEDTIISGFYEENSIILKFKNPNIKDNNTETETIEIINESNEIINDINYEKNILEKIKIITDKLPKDYFNPYDNWLKLCFIIYNETNGTLNGYNLFLDICKKLSGFNETECFNQWNKYNKKNKSLKIASLVKMYNDYLKEIKKEDIKKKINVTIIADNDNKAGKIIFEDLKDKIFYYKDDYFYKIDNIWTNNSNTIKNLLVKYIQNKNIKKIVETKDGQKIMSYSENISSAKHILESLYGEIIENSINEINGEMEKYMKFHSTTKNKLCFIDGVLDMKNKKFYEWDEIDFEYYSTVMIKRKFKDYFYNPNKDIIDKIETDLIENMYGDKKEKALQFLSRAITGNIEDKKWSFYIGNRNCGKGVLFDALKASFGDYVQAFNLSNLLYSKNTKGKETEDPAKSMGWCMDFEFSRIAISQEVPPLNSGLTMSGEAFKKLASGGDKIYGRKLHKDPKEFNIDTTFMIFGNNSLTIDAEDTWEECLQFSSVNQFKTAEEIAKYKMDGVDELEMKRYKLKDINIKDNVKTEEWCNAFVYLLMTNYEDKAVYIPKEESDDNEGVSILKLIKTHYDITNKENDLIKVNDLYKQIDCNDKKKIQTELQSINIFKKKCNSKIKGMEEFKDKWIFIGLKLKEESNEIINNNNEKNKIINNNNESKKFFNINNEKNI